MHRAFEVFRAHHAPFVTAVAARMLEDLRRDVAAHPGHRVVFLGRDAHAYAAATRGLDPDFFLAHCTEIVVSRVVVDAALQDLERHTGARFDDVEPFRVRGRVHPSEIHGAFQNLTRYLVDAGVPVARTGSTATLVDNSLRGTIQELLTAAYTATRFTGRYALHLAHPADPHPGTKTGYALHQPVSPRWQGLPEADLPREIELTFACDDGLSAIEDTLNGPDSSPRTISSRGPVQHPQRALTEPLRGLNPLTVHPDLRDPLVRDATKTAALLAVHDFAAATRHQWTPWSTAGERGRLAVQHGFALQIRAWIKGDATVLDPRLGVVLDSFVLREDHAVIAHLQELLAQRSITGQAVADVWAELRAAPDLATKQQVAIRITEALAPGPSATHPAATAAAIFRTDRGSRSDGAPQPGPRPSGPRGVPLTRGTGSRSL